MVRRSGVGVWVLVLAIGLGAPAVRPGRAAQPSVQHPGPVRVLQEGMWGQDVFELQLALQELGFKVLDATGYFGPATRAAVQRLQRAVGLDPDGVVGPVTRRVLEGLSQAYSYRVRPGDTLWDLARRFGTTMEAIMDENGLTDTALRPGQLLAIPSVRRLWVPVSMPLRELATRLGVPVGTLAEINGLSPRQQVQAGDEIWIPRPRF